MRRIVTPFLFLSTFFILITSMKPSTNNSYVKFDSNLFVSKFELTNEEYRMFLNELRRQNNENMIAECLPDSAQWIEKMEYNFNAPYTNLYHWHPAYNNYPAVNLSKEAVDLYCIWLTDKYNADPKRKINKVSFRLPTEKEWMKFSSTIPGSRLPWIGDLPYKLGKKDQLIPLANIKVRDYAMNSDNYILDGAMITCSVGNYKENKLGIYDIIGNAAECTSEGKIKGGSWFNSLDECLIDKTQDYTLPDPRVGFRLVMEVIEK